MNIIIKKTAQVTEGFENTIQKKFLTLTKFVKHFDETGEAEIWVEISRTTKRHRHGEVFKVTADLRLPKKILRAETYAEDMRTAIDEAKNTLRTEIEKYKTQFVELHKKKLGK
jgi:ribosomal subunit interface protein